MSAPSWNAAARARCALDLSAGLVELSDDAIEQRGPHFVVGQLQEALREASRVIEALLAEWPATS